MDVNVDVNHKKKHSGGELKIVYGKDVKDKTKEMTFSASLDRKFTSLEKMDIEYKVTATVPTLVCLFLNSPRLVWDAKI